MTDLQKDKKETIFANSFAKKRRLVNHVGEKNLNGYFFRSKMFSAKNESTSIQNFFSLVAICSHGSKGGHSCYIFVVL